MAESKNASSGSCRLLIVNYSGYVVGDDAIFEALLSILSKAKGPHVIIDALTALPQRTLRRYPIVEEADHLYTFMASQASWRRVLDLVSRADVIFIGGGDIVEGQLALLVLTVLAIFMGTPIAYVGVGVLPPDSMRQRRVLRWSVDRARFVATRDPESSRLLHNLGVRRPPVHTVPDLAIGLEAQGDNPQSLLANDNISLTRPYVVVNLRAPDLAQYGMGWGDAEYNTIAEVCRTLIDQDDYDIVCVPLVLDAVCIAFGLEEPGDDQVMEHLAQRIDRPNRVYILRHEYRPGEVATVLTGARLAIGMRLHFVVLAANGAVPLIALSYARKVRAFMASVGLEDFCLEVRGIETTALSACIDRAQRERDSIRKRLIAWHQDAVSELEPLGPSLVALIRPVTALRVARRIATRPLLLFAMYLYRAVKV